MKRSAVLLLAAAFCLCGCINSTQKYVDPAELGFTDFPPFTGSLNTDIPTTAGAQAAPQPSPTPAPSPQFEETTVIDEQSVKVIVTDLHISKDGNAELLFTIENSTESDITVYATDIQVNSKRVSGVFEENVEANASSDTATHRVDKGELEQLEIDVLKSVGMSISVRTNNNTKELLTSRPVVISAKVASQGEAPQSTPSDAPQPSSDYIASSVNPGSQTVLVDESDVLLSLLTTEKSSKGLYINFLMENRSGSDVSFSLSELQLNGQSIYLHAFVKDCERGKQEKETIWVPSDSLNDSGISNLESMELNVRIYNGDGDIFNDDVRYDIVV